MDNKNDAVSALKFEGDLFLWALPVFVAIFLLLTSGVAHAQSSLPTPMPGSVGMFATDGTNMYFVDSYWGNTAEYKKVVDTKLIKDANTASFVVDGIWQEFTTITVKAHDKNHRYIATQIRFGCYGNTIGCVLGTFLTVR